MTTTNPPLSRLLFGGKMEKRRKKSIFVQAKRRPVPRKSKAARRGPKHIQFFCIFQSARAQRGKFCVCPSKKREEWTIWITRRKGDEKGLEGPSSIYIYTFKTDSSTLHCTPFERWRGEARERGKKRDAAQIWRKKRVFSSIKKGHSRKSSSSVAKAVPPRSSAASLSAAAAALPHLL